MTTGPVYDGHMALGVDRLGGQWFGYCTACEWSGPWRRRKWLALLDVERHHRAFRKANR